MNIFEIVNNQVTFSPQALMIKPFREIWDCDKSKDKFQATLELSYVYYMSDERSDYMYILDEEERHDQIVSDLELGDNWIKPKYIDTAIVYYKRLSETTSTKLLESTRNVIEKISGFLDTIDINERDSRNKPVHDITKITNSVEKIPKLIRALNDIEKEIIREKELKAQSGNKIVGIFDTNEGI